MKNRSVVRFWPSFAAAGQIFVVCAVLLGSLSYQFVLGELPCPLCVVQRLAFLLACVGPMGILLATQSGRCTSKVQVHGFALCILASLVGMVSSSRQVLLHIVPPDPGYGPPVLGLHLYTWADLVFVCLIGSSALGLLGLQDNPPPFPRFLTIGLTGLILVLGLIVACATFAMEGFSFKLPDDPIHYELFHPRGSANES